MAKNIFDYSELMDLSEQFEKIPEELGEAIQNSLTKTAEQETANLKGIVHSGNYPAGGMYSTGLTASKIADPMTVDSGQYEYMIRWGFDLKIGDGAFYKVPIFLTYGTPSMPAVKNLKSSLFSSAILSRFHDNLERDIEKVIGK